MLDKQTKMREEYDRIRLNDEKRSLREACEDYETNVLLDPPIPLDQDQLFEIKQHAMSAGEERHRHPDYVWSQANFMEAERINDRRYFIDATITDMPRVQRLLKRSSDSFHHFSAYAGQWFRQSRPLQKLWILMWKQGAIGRPNSPSSAPMSRQLQRLSRFEMLGLCDPGFEQRVREHQDVVQRAMDTMTTWQTEDDQLHIRVATAAGPVGVEPPTPTILPISPTSTSSPEEGAVHNQQNNNAGKSDNNAGKSEQVNYRRHPPISTAGHYKRPTDTPSPDTAALFDSPLQVCPTASTNAASPSPDTAALSDSPTPVKRRAAAASSDRKVNRELFRSDGSSTTQKVRRIVVDTSSSSEMEPGEYKVSDESDSEEVDMTMGVTGSMPKGSLDSEAEALLQSKGGSDGPAKVRALAAKFGKPESMRRSRTTGPKKETRKSSLLRQTVREAEEYGAYAPVLTNGRGAVRLAL